MTVFNANRISANQTLKTRSHKSQYGKEIDDTQLLGIKGRGRKIQVELARKYHLLEEYYASGGCLLTDKSYSFRAKDLINYSKDLKINDFKIFTIINQIFCSK